MVQEFVKLPILYSISLYIEYTENCVISGLRRGVNEIFALLGFHAAQIGS